MTVAGEQHVKCSQLCDSQKWKEVEWGLTQRPGGRSVFRLTLGREAVVQEGFLKNKLVD